MMIFNCVPRTWKSGTKTGVETGDLPVETHGSRIIQTLPNKGSFTDKL